MKIESSSDRIASDTLYREHCRLASLGAGLCRFFFGLAFESAWQAIDKCLKIMHLQLMPER
jgi:hypothetical protein